MRVYYANERGKGLVIIAGNAGKVARCVDSCAYRESESALAAEIKAACREFRVKGAPVRFATIAELESAYGKPL